MNVYISCSSADLEKYIHYYSKIRNSVLQLGHNISGDWLDRVVKRLGKINSGLKVIPNIKEEGIKAIEQSACLVADVSMPSSSVGYQIAHALTKKIPTLCLYSEQFGRKSPPQIIDATTSSLLRIESYNDATLKDVIKHFFEDFPSEKLIKFNFIITPEIDEYLEWGSEESGISKSEFLREKVADLIKSDPKYKAKKR